MIRCEKVTVTAGTSVANAQGTAISNPIQGDIVSIRNPGTALGGTCDYTFTRVNDGGTILSGVDMAGPWQYQPASAYHVGTTAAGTSAGVPCAGHVQVVIGSAVASATGTVFIYYRQGY